MLINCLKRSATLVLSMTLLAAACTPTEEDDLKPIVESVINEYPDQTIAVAVRDPANGYHLDINGDTLLHAASTMKVPVMMEIYRQAAMQKISLDDSLLVENRFRSIVDGSEYSIEVDSDDDIYTRLGTRMTIRDLVFSMITVSSNLATNLLIDFANADSVQVFIESLGTSKMRVLRGVEDIKAFRQGLSNSATANDLAILMEALMTSGAVSSKDDAEMVDVLLAQKFNSLIPAGLPGSFKVAHKTGWITGIRHDAAIVYPPSAEPYVLVILTGGFEQQDDAVAAIQRLTQVINTELRSF